MPDGNVVVGVDAGGTGTVATCNAGATRSLSARYGPGNPSVYGVERSAGVIASAVEDALGGRKPDAIAVGAAGAGREQVAGALRTALEKRFPGARICVVDDARIALRAAVPHGDGIVLVAGTGSIAYGEVAGRCYRAGGYGYAFGDDGSGFAIGSAALRRLTRWFEGRVPADAMLEALAAQLGVRTAADVAARVYGDIAPVAAVAALAPIVIAHAGLGERTASEIVQAAAGELFELIRTIWRAADVGDSDMPVGLGGGLLHENSMLTFLLETRLANELPPAHIRKGAASSDGALALARELLASP